MPIDRIAKRLGLTLGEVVSLAAMTRPAPAPRLVKNPGEFTLEEAITFATMTRSATIPRLIKNPGGAP
jgi:hypothetical protein